MAIEIVDFPINNGDFPVRYVNLPEGIWLGRSDCSSNWLQFFLGNIGAPILVAENRSFRPPLGNLVIGQEHKINE